jgi:hypothetical protein
LKWLACLSEVVTIPDEAEGRVVGQQRRLVAVPDANDRRDRPEDLLRLMRMAFVVSVKARAPVENFVARAGLLAAPCEPRPSTAHLEVERSWSN